MKLVTLGLLCLAASPVVFAAAEPNLETLQIKELSDNKDYQNFQKEHGSQDRFYGSPKDFYTKAVDNIVVPGFISASPLENIATIVGPETINVNYRMGDTLYLRWNSPHLPRVGERFQTFTPAIVLQSTANPTDFTVSLGPTYKGEPLPKGRRMAGYFYESTGRLKIIKVSQGLVEAVLEALSGQVAKGDQLMPMLPVRKNLQSTAGSMRLAAAIVSGSPPERISTTKRSFIYINRGSRDGIKVGNVFEAIESVKLDASLNVTAPELSAGEAVVIFTTEAYSTAMITKQFDVIRIGSLLRVKNSASPLSPSAPFANMPSYSELKKGEPKMDVPEVPTIDLPGDDLPDPLKHRNPPPTVPAPPQQTQAPVKPKPSALSELDQLEKSQKFNNLTPEEKLRLGTLSRQERVGVTPAPSENEEEAPPTPGLDNSFGKGKKPAKKSAKKKAQTNDEEELNLLMQN